MRFRTNGCSKRKSGWLTANRLRKTFLEELIAVFELPLFGGSFAGAEEGEASGCGVLCSDGLCGTGRVYRGEVVGTRPEAGAGEEAVLERGADHLLEIEIGETEVEDGAGVLMGYVDAGDAFVVGGERDRNS